MSAKKTLLEDNPSEDFFTVKQAAEYLRVNQNTIYRMCNDREIKSFQVGRQWRIVKKMMWPWVAP